MSKMCREGSGMVTQLYQDLYQKKQPHPHEEDGAAGAPRGGGGEDPQRMKILSHHGRSAVCFNWRSQAPSSAVMWPRAHASKTSRFSFLAILRSVDSGIPASRRLTR